jgi:RcsF protein
MQKAGNPAFFTGFKMKYLIIAAALCLSACSNFEFTSNIAPSNFKEYFKPSAVTEVDSETLDSVKNRNLGLVEGLSCQITERDEIATEAAARTDARIKAANMGANAIKFGKCVHLKNTPACHVSVTCYAEALVVDDPQ